MYASVAAPTFFSRGPWWLWTVNSSLGEGVYGVAGCECPWSACASASASVLRRTRRSMSSVCCVFEM